MWIENISKSCLESGLTSKKLTESSYWNSWCWRTIRISPQKPFKIGSKADRTFFDKKAFAEEHFGTQIHILEGYSITWHHPWCRNVNEHSCHPTQGVKRLMFTPKPWASCRQIIWTFSLSSLQPSRWPSLLVSNHIHTQLYCKLGFSQHLLQVTDLADGGFEGIIVAMVTANHSRSCYNSGVCARGDTVVVEIDSIFATPETTPTWTKAMACSRKPSGSRWTALQVPAKAGN